MSLQLILGGSGSGKSYFLYKNLIEESIVNPEGSYFVIVPEQFTMETQKEIVELHPKHGVMNIDIVSFQRLAFRIFEELALENPEVLDDMGKSMVLRKVAASKQKELGYYAGHLHKLGFISQLKSVLSEFYQYGIRLEEVKRMKEQTKTQGLLHEKLKDLEVLYQAFQDYLKDSYITTEEILEVLCRVVAESELIKNSVITLDGYTGFTPIQYRLIGLLMRHARRISITVTIDPQELRQQSNPIQNLFYLSKNTIQKLRQLAGENGTGMEADVVLGRTGMPRFQNSPALAFLEKSFYRFNWKPFAKEPEEISVHACKNPAMEADFAAGIIFRLVREEGYRYRDIAVITGDVAGYRNVIAEKFESGKIPYFLDDKRSILGNPLVEVMRAALLIVDESFSYESVFRYLKTGMPGIAGADVDILENYVRALGIRGRKRWNQVWERTYRGAGELNLDHINAIREAVLEPLLPFWEAVKKKEATARDYTEALFYLIYRLSAEDKLKQYTLEFEKHQDHSRAREYEQAYALVLELLDRMVSLLGDEQIRLKEYKDILDAGFEEIKVGIIPSCIDQVVVGDIERTRLKDVKALFFIGLNDGIVPASSDKGNLFSETEREYLDQNHMELAPTVKKNSFIQRFYLYLLMTKPERKLYLSYAKMSSDGTGRRPSYLIGMIRKLFPDIRAIDEELSTNTLDRIITEHSAIDMLIAGLREHKGMAADPDWKELYRWFAQKPEYQKQLQQLLDAAFYHYTENGISGAVAKALYGNILSGSVTRLEKYAACAYAHFLTYGLELVKRQEFELATMDLGNIFHSSIDLYFKEFEKRDYDWETVTPEQRKELVDDCVKQVTEEYGNTILQSSARNIYLTGRLARITDRTVWALGEQIKKGDFKPAAFEVGFSASDTLDASTFQLSAEEEMHLKGRIDRLDIYEDEEYVYLKIIDYKSGSTSFDIAALYYGLQLQLVVYLDAAMEIEQGKHPDKEVVPAGIFYYNIQDPVIEREEGMTDEEIEEKILKQLRMNGLVNREDNIIEHMDRDLKTDSAVIPVTKSAKTGEIMEHRSSVAGKAQFQQLRTYVHNKLGDMGREILDGDISINPYKQGTRTACDYCEYGAVCGFDLKAGGFSYRRFKKHKTEEIWSRIYGETEADTEAEEDKS